MPPAASALVRKRQSGGTEKAPWQAVETALVELSERLSFRVVPGLTERVIYRELFPRGLTLLDLRDAGDEVKLTMSLIAARQEVAQMVSALGIGADVISSESTGRNRP